mmetsp:Transcript_1731/g.2551  ORF Transcript_1731/g.2551 Transcript_1731/m.2551 type:complete len:432 (+) Transcript_1731:67-1362(+)
MKEGKEEPTTLDQIEKEKKKTRTWKEAVKVTTKSKRTINPIRMILKDFDMKNTDKTKELISLSIGDPTVYGNLNPPVEMIEQLKKNALEGKSNGYQHSMGLESARRAIAKYAFGKESKEEKYMDVCIASGASGALDIAINALVDPGCNMLIPVPGFSLYETLLKSMGGEPRFYNLKPEKGWEADIEHMESLIDEKTRAILVNNPSNPCGSVYTKKHLEDILKVADKYCVPIIADEIYGDITFEKPYIPMHTLTKTVPIIQVSGLAKQWLVPGWRIGWLVLHDRQFIFDTVDMRSAIFRLSTILMGSNTLCQSVIPTALENIPESFFEKNRDLLKTNANYCAKRVENIEGLNSIQPEGAMYMMFGIDVNQFDGSFVDDLSFAKLLLKEESIVVLPGQCFHFKNYVRIVYCAPLETLKTAFDRIEAFCKKYHL